MGKIKIKLDYLLFLAFLSLPLLINAQNDNEVEVGHVYFGEVDYKGFSLNKSATIKIKGKAARYEHWNENADFYGWILDSKSRKVVWHLFSDYEDDVEDGIFDVDTEVKLKAGDYEVYYTANKRDHENYFTLGGFFNNVFGSKEKRHRSRDRGKLSLTFSGPAGVFNSNLGEEYVDKIANDAIVSLIRVGDDEQIEKGFALKADTKIRIYALGEGRKREIYDFAWIYNSKTREKVWEMDNWDSDYAGGGRKNLLFDEVIELTKGNYVVNFVTDDSHSFYEWNVYPPDDPQFYGITVSAVSANDKKNVVAFEDWEKIKPVLDLTRIGDDEFVSKGIRIKKDMDLRVLSIGEGYGKELADYGWIIDAETKKTIWDMNETKTKHAGGASKNRIAEEIIKLKKGNYIAYFASDDSHAYGDWNDSPPYEKNHWGISLWLVNENDKNYIEDFDESEFKSKNVIASITRVRDDQYLSETFELEKDTKVRIVAIGEGYRGEMSDYGWIKNLDKDRIIWEMTYRKTEHAGGAGKNREFNDTILLSAGRYKVYYETDGSHSYRDWNASPPHNKEGYGITILKEK